MENYIIIIIIIISSSSSSIQPLGRSGQRPKLSQATVYIYIFKIPSVEGSGMSVQYIEIIMAKGLKKARRIVEHLEGKFPV